MSRVRFLEIEPKEFLKKVQNETDLTFRELAKICKVHRRSFSDWKHGKYLMPGSVFKKLVEISNFDSPKVKILPDFWYTEKAGRKGGSKGGPAVYKKYGKIPGWTKEASRRGALKASETHRKRGTGLFATHSVSLPKRSSQLAELVGIILGDGGLTSKQITVSLNRIEDQGFIPYVKSLFQDLFEVTPSVYERKAENTANIVVSSTKLVQFFTDMNLCIGDKVKQQVEVPSWIGGSKKFTACCLRGLLDTDGCFYIDKHHYKNRVYRNCGMNFTNHSLPVLSFFKTKLRQRSFHPTQSTRFSIFLRREDEVVRYFQIIGSANPRHLNKFIQYFKDKRGEVPKFGHTGTVSKTAGRK